MSDPGPQDPTAPRDAGSAAPIPPETGNVLVVDDQKNMRATTAMLLRQAGHRVGEAADGTGALEQLAQGTYDVILTDLRMPTLDGMELLKAVQRSSPQTQVIVMTAYGTIESAVEAMRRGAYDFLTKPFKSDEVLLRVGKALEKRRLLGEVTLFAEEFRKRYGLEHIVGRSAAMRDVLERVMRVGIHRRHRAHHGRVRHRQGAGGARAARGQPPERSPVRARELRRHHRDAARVGAVRPCASGAFTGAVRARRGLFEEADGGTLFIDEVGETTPGFQAKLLRVLQEGEIRRVGESVSVKVDVRVIAATNRDLRRAIAEKRFREDLFYRLNVVPLRIPPLRERPEDVPLLAAHFLERFNRRTGSDKVLTAEGAARLLEHGWPGNVRELENALEQAAALCPSREIRAQDIHIEAVRPAQGGTPGGTLAQAVEDAERRTIEAALHRNDHDLPRVARELGVSSTTLWRKMKRLGIEGRDPPGGA